MEKKKKKRTQKKKKMEKKEEEKKNTLDDKIIKDNETSDDVTGNSQSLGERERESEREIWKDLISE